MQQVFLLSSAERQCFIPSAANTSLGQFDNAFSAVSWHPMLNLLIVALLANHLVLHLALSNVVCALTRCVMASKMFIGGLNWETNDREFAHSPTTLTSIIPW